MIRSSGFALTSTQGVTSLPHNSTKSRHSAIPITTTAFFIMLFNFPFGTMPCLSHPTGFHLKASQSTVLSNVSTCITTTMTISVMYLPRNSLGSCSREGSCYRDQSPQLQPSDHGDTRIADVLNNRFFALVKKTLHREAYDAAL